MKKIFSHFAAKFLTLIVLTVNTVPHTGNSGSGIDSDVRNLNGMELVIGTQYYTKEPTTPEYHALQAYREELMKKHNFTVRVERLYDFGDPIHVFQTATTLGDPTFQVYHINSRYLADNCHLFYDLSTLSEFDFSDTKWNGAVTKSMSYKDGIYGMSPLTIETPQIGGIVYNKRLFKEAGLDPNLPYELQKNGEWTWENFKEICTLLTRDTDKDGKTDVYATCSYNGEMLEQILSSTGSQIVTKDNGNFVNNATSDTILRAVTFAQELALSGYEMPFPQNGYWNYYETAFSSGQAAMQFTKSNVLYDKNHAYTQMKDELGFVCCPKMNSSVDYQMITESYVAVIPAFYDEKTASDIAFAYNLWTNPLPTDVSSDYDWHTIYDDYVMDEKILTETFPYYYEKNISEIPAHYLVTNNVDTTFYYPFPFTNAPITQYLDNLSDILAVDVTKVNSAKKPNVTLNTNIPDINYSTRVNYDGTVTISRFKRMVPKDLVLPDEINGMVVSEIGCDAFSNCNLTSVVLPKGLKKIGMWAFAFGDFTEFVLPEGMETICQYAITGSNLQTIVVPASVTEIEKEAFSSNADLTLIVEKGSYAETYARENGINVRYKQ